MINKSYDHPVLQAFRMDKIEKSLGEHFHTEHVLYADNSNVRLVVAKDPGLKGFYHPLVTDRYEIVVDARSFAKLDRDNETLIISNHAEYNFNVLRAQLELSWQHDGRFGMINLSTIPANFYTKWVSETIARAYNLSPEKQMITSLISALYFFCQFRPSEEWDTGAIEPKAVSFISRATGIQAQTVLTYLPNIVYIETFNDFVNMLLETIHDGTFQGLTSRSLYSILSSNWRGAHANEIAMLALSYPPTFFAMVVSAYADRSYKNTPLQKIIDRTSKQVDVKSFALSVKSMLMAVREDYS